MSKPIQYRGPLDGKSRGHVMTLGDGKEYVIKFVRRGYEKVLPNEWLGYCLARFMQLPVPYSKMVHVPKSIFQELHEEDDLVYTPTQFATEYIPHSMSLRQYIKTQSGRPRVRRAETLAGIIVLDYWLYNRDRNRNNVLLSQEKPNSWQVWMIDQGDLLGSTNWTTEHTTEQNQALFPSGAHKWMAKLINRESAFGHYLNVIQTIPRLSINEILDQVPGDWHLSEAERKAVADWLVVRRDKELKPLIRRFIKTIYREQHSG